MISYVNVSVCNFEENHRVQRSLRVIENRDAERAFVRGIVG